MRAGRIGALIPALALVVTAACTSGERSAPAPPMLGRSGGTLRVGMETAPQYTMDPTREWNYITWGLFRCCLVRTLMSHDVSGDAATLDPLPDLATAPPDVSVDGLTWTFHIRPGIRYAPPLQDVEITSGDFVRALQRLATTYNSVDDLGFYLHEIQGWDDYAAGDATSVVGLQAPDPYTLRIVEAHPDASLPYLLALPMAAPIPPRPGSPDDPFGVATGHNAGGSNSSPLGGYGQFLVASGPYMVEGAGEMDLSLPPKEQVPASGFDPWIVKTDREDNTRTTHFGSLTLVRNPSWDSADDPLRAALPDRIEIQGAKADRLFRQMAAGDLDLVLDVPPPPRMLRRYQSDPELRPLIQTPDGPSRIKFATFNLAMPPFDDLAVRRAVAFALDRASLAAVFREVDRSSATVANHFAPDTFEASLLSGWSPFPGGGGDADLGAARKVLATSRYVSHGRCIDPACRDIPVLVDERYPAAVPIVRRAFEALGMRADVQLGNLYESCTDPSVHVGFCVGQGWVAEFPSAEGFIASLFASDGTYPATRLGARPNQLRRWGYEVPSVPSVDAAVARCAQEVGSTQPSCWARLDQYVVSQLMPAVPISFFGLVLLSSPSIGPFPWDEVLAQPALERIEPAG